MAVEDLWTNRLRTRLKVYILQGICEAEFNSVTPRVCVESTFRLGCEGSVDHKEQVDTTCRCLGAGKQEQNAVVKSLLLLFNLFQIPPEIVGAVSKQRLSFEGV